MLTQMFCIVALLQNLNGYPQSVMESPIEERTVIDIGMRDLVGIYIDNIDAVLPCDILPICQNMLEIR